MTDLSDIRWFELFTALDQFLLNLAVSHELLIYVILFLIIFLETALLPFTFFPGDSLLFVSGAVAAAGAINPVILMLVLIVGGIAGNTVGYLIGRWLGKKIYSGRYSWLDTEKLDKTKNYYDKHGAITLVLARFIPVVRSGAPLVAGAAYMEARRFHTYSFIGAVIWVVSLTGGGMLFGDIPAIKDNLGLILLVGMSVVILPICGLAFWRLARKFGNYLYYLQRR